jgi:hypothetical protein
MSVILASPPPDHLLTLPGNFPVAIILGQAYAAVQARA